MSGKGMRTAGEEAKSILPRIQPAPKSWGDYVRTMAAIHRRHGGAVNREPCKAKNCDGWVHWMPVTDEQDRCTGWSGDCDGECKGSFGRPEAGHREIQGNVDVSDSRLPPAAVLVLDGKSCKRTQAMRVTAAGLAEHKLVVLSGVACGKTVALTWALRDWMRRHGSSALYVTAASVLDLTRNREDKPRHDALQGVGLLAIDGLDGEHLGRGQVLPSRLRDLLLARTDAGRRTLVATTMSRGELRLACGSSGRSQASLWRRVEPGFVALGPEA